jgi:4'-phosphopantetheinyl transferase
LSAERSLLILGEEEQQRANRFKHELDRQRYFASHAALRIVLGHFLERPPQDIEFAQEAFGKPCLKAAPALHFNLSHSGKIALIAVSRASPVGVDIEAIETVAEPLPLSQLAEPERLALSVLGPAARRIAFIRCWVRKEAVLKGVGHGLSHGLKDICVPVDEHSTPAIVDVPGHGPWRIVDLTSGGGDLAALAVRDSANVARPRVHDLRSLTPR